MIQSKLEISLNFETTSCQKQINGVLPHLMSTEIRSPLEFI